MDKREREDLKKSYAKTYQKIQERCEKGIKTKLDHFDAATIANIASKTSFSGVHILLKELRRNIIENHISSSQDGVGYYSKCVGTNGNKWNK